MSIKNLQLLLGKGEIPNESFIRLKGDLKPVFFSSTGFMAWARNKYQDKIKAELEGYARTLLDDDKLDADSLVLKYTNRANSLNQGGQNNLFYSLPRLFPIWPMNKLNSNAETLALELICALKKGGDERERAIMLMAQFAEGSNAQSRKSTSGSVAENTVELVLIQAGLVIGKGYAKQWKSSDGSDTDFIIPFSKNGEADDILAYIAVQSSSNDRVRLSSSELHQGAKRFLCSLNGCDASSKSTDDIGRELVAGYVKSENYYVVIGKEKERASAVAKKRLNEAEEIGDKNEISMAKARVKWLKHYTYSFNEFAEFAKKTV